MNYPTLALILVTLLGSVNASANGNWEFNGTISSLAIESDAALREGVEDSALQIGFYADYLQSDWVSTMGFSLLMYDDNRTFRQKVVGSGLYNDGAISTESSDANAILIHLATGYRWTFGEAEQMDFITQGGYSFSAQSERSIDYCSDCFAEDIDLDGGAFIKARLGHNTESVRFGLLIQQFISGDLGTVVGLEIGSSF